MVGRVLSICYIKGVISSTANPRIKWLRQLIREPADDIIAVEGVRAVEELVRCQAPVTEVFYSERLEQTPRGVTILQSLTERGAEKVHVSAAVLDKVSATEHGQGVVATVARPRARLEDCMALGRPLFLLDAVADPGNLGAIIRIADAFAFGGLVLGRGCVSPFNPKVVRSAVGSLFRLPVVDAADLAAVSHELTRNGYQMSRAEAAGGISLRHLPRSGKRAVILGSEAHGVSEEVAGVVSEALHIPMPGSAESLNVAMAAAIIAYALADS
jgi:RNA methyltransferase, TrmH family